MSTTARYKLREQGVSWHEIDGDILALDHRTSVYISVNTSGVVLWRTLVIGATELELVERLVSDFGVARERAAADVEGFLNQLTAQGLLER